MRAYGQSKIANVLFANELARRLKNDGVTANALHPGVIATNLGRHMNPLLGVVFGVFGFWMMKSVAQGAATSCYVATHPDNDDVTGKYFADCRIAPASETSQSIALAEQLWQTSEALIQSS